MHVCWGVHFAPSTSSNLSEMCSIGFKLISGHGGPGQNLDDVVGEELCGVACCVGLGAFVLKYSAIQRLMPEIKQQKSLNSIKWFV